MRALCACAGAQSAAQQVGDLPFFVDSVSPSVAIYPAALTTMKCQACKFDSPAGAQWCDFCGNPFNGKSPRPTSSLPKPMESMQPGATSSWTVKWATLPAWVRFAVWAFLAVWMLEIAFLAGYKKGRNSAVGQPSENGESSSDSPFADTPPSDLPPTEH